MSRAVARVGPFACALLLYCLSITFVSANTDSNPYQSIVDRNVFGLKDPPPPPPPGPDPGKTQSPPITLTGIMTILGKKTAFMSFPAPAKPPEPAKQSSIMLTEGQRDGEIEVLQIDEKGGSVKVSSYGTVTNLTFEKNGTKPSGGSAAATTAGVPAAIPASQTAVFTPGGSAPASSSNPGIQAMPARMIRTSPSPIGQPAVPPGAPPPVFTPGSPAPSVAGGLSFDAPTRPVGQEHYEDMNLTLEQREVLTDLYHQKAVESGDPIAAIYPPSLSNPARNLTPSPTDIAPTTQPQPGSPTPVSPGFARRHP